MEIGNVVLYHRVESSIIVNAYVPVCGLRPDFQKLRLLALIICVTRVPLTTPKILT